MNKPAPQNSDDLARQLALFGTTMAVIVGAGILINGYNVAPLLAR